MNGFLKYNGISTLFNKYEELRYLFINQKQRSNR